MEAMTEYISSMESFDVFIMIAAILGIAVLILGIRMVYRMVTKNKK